MDKTTATRTRTKKGDTSHFTCEAGELPVVGNRHKHARQNTPAKKTLRRVMAWLDARNNREIKIDWVWSATNSWDRSGVFVVYEDGVEVLRRYFQRGRLDTPAQDLASVHSGSWKHLAMESMIEALEARGDADVH